MPDIFKPTDDELFALAHLFDQFMSANGVQQKGVVTAQVIDFPLVGPAPYTYDPTIFISYRDNANRLHTYDLQLISVLGNTGRDDIARELRIAFGVANREWVPWQNFVSPPVAVTETPKPVSLVGAPIEGQPGFYAPTYLAGWDTPAGVRYLDPLGRGWFVWVASLFDRKWQKLG